MRFGNNIGFDDLVINDTQFGIYWIRTGAIHRTGMTYEQALTWLNEAEEDFPQINVRDKWAICQAKWEPAGTARL